MPDCARHAAGRYGARPQQGQRAALGGVAGK
jgi:hypothetical protein